MQQKISKKDLQNMIKEEIEEVLALEGAEDAPGGAGMGQVGGKEKGDVARMKARRAKLSGSEQLEKSIDTNVELAQHIRGEFQRILDQNPDLNAKRALMMLLQAKK